MRYSDRRCARSALLPSLFVALSLLVPGPLHAWGGFTHQRLSHAVLQELANDVPGARRVLQDTELLAAFLGGSMVPDIAQDFFHGNADDKLHGLFHQPAFAEALVEASRDDPEALAMALGWKAHIVEDRSAHGPQGYSDNKKTYVGPTTGSDHAIAEGLMDVLSLEQPGPHRAAAALDPERVAAVATALGSPLSREEAIRLWKRFRKSTDMAETLFLAVAARQRRGIMPSIAAFYSDSVAGLVEGRGTKSALAETPAALKTDFERFSAAAEDERSGRPASRIGGRLERLGGALAALGARLPGSGALSDVLVSGLEKAGLMKRGADLEFFRRLLVTKEKDFETFRSGR